MRTANRPKYPGVVVKLTLHDEKANVIVGRVIRVMTSYGVPKPEREVFRSEALSGDWDNLIATCHRYVQVR
jgi:hypothetical protein